jgi:outer membrane lipoprotein SlyB
MKTKLTLVLSTLLAATVSVNAGQIDGGAVVGSMLGAGVGSAVGSATGGKNGAIIGGGVGGAVGAAVGSKDQPRAGTRENAVYVEGRNRDDYREHHDNGKHKGQHKHHDRD